MTAGLTCAHEWTRDASGTTVVLRCRTCGTSSAASRRLRGQVVTASLDLYPATGAAAVSADAYEFFVRQWEAECKGLAEAGYTVKRRAPSLHTKPRSVSPSRAQSTPWLRGRDVALGAGIALVCGVTALVLGLSFHVGWLTVVGGGILAVLALLTLLVIFLSS